MKNKLLVIIAVMIGTAGMASPPEEGKSIFLSRCASCHIVNKISVGPALAGVDERRSIDWIIRFVTSSQSVIKSGDTAAVALYEKFNRVPMPDHPDLSADDIRNIVEYVKSQAKDAKEEAPFAKPGELKTPYRPLSLKDDMLVFICYLGVVGLLIAMLLFGVRLNEFRRKQKESAGL